MEETDNEYIDWEWPHKHLDHLIGYNYFIGGQFKSRIWSYQVICRVCKKLILATDFVTFSKSCKLIPYRCKTASDLAEKEASAQWQNSQQRPRQGTKEVQAGEPTAGAYTALPANQAGEPTEAGKPTEAGRHREAYPALPACPDAPQRDQLLVLQGHPSRWSGGGLRDGQGEELRRDRRDRLHLPPVRHPEQLGRQEVQHQLQGPAKLGLGLY